MKSECCKNCFYLTSKNSKDFPLSDYHIEYACEFHNTVEKLVIRMNKGVMIGLLLNPELEI